MAGNLPLPSETNPRRIVQAIRELFEGRSNAVGTVTLTAGAASTVVTAINCGPDSVVMLMPATANAAADFGSGNLYVSSVGAGTFTVAHPNDADTDKTFFYVCLG